MNKSIIIIGAGIAGLSAGCSEIYLQADGQGPMGWYDRVHVLYEDGRHVIFPAHHCKEFTLKEEQGT